MPGENIQSWTSLSYLLPVHQWIGWTAAVLAAPQSAWSEIKIKNKNKIKMLWLIHTHNTFSAVLITCCVFARVWICPCTTCAPETGWASRMYCSWPVFSCTYKQSTQGGGKVRFSAKGHLNTEDTAIFLLWTTLNPSLLSDELLTNSTVRFVLPTKQKQDAKLTPA